MVYLKHYANCLQYIITIRVHFSPQSNGAAERANSMILSTLRCYLDDKKDQWEFFLPSVLAALRGTVSKSTGLFTVFFAL